MIPRETGWYWWRSTDADDSVRKWPMCVEVLECGTTERGGLVIRLHGADIGVPEPTEDEFMCRIPSPERLAAMEAYIAEGAIESSGGDDLCMTPVDNCRFCSGDVWRGKGHDADCDWLLASPAWVQESEAKKRERWCPKGANL